MRCGCGVPQCSVALSDVVSDCLGRRRAKCEGASRTCSVTMFTMFARAIATLLVLVLVGPSVVAAACELTCAMGSHHHNAPASTAAPCHEHQGAEQTAGVRANSSALCHESGDLPSAVIDAWLTTLVVPATPATTVAVAAALSVTSIVRAHDRSTVLDPRPPHRPLRV